MNRDIPHGEHWAIVQMIGQDAKRWPLKIVKYTCKTYLTYTGMTDYYWSSQYFTGLYNVLAVFLTEKAANECRKVLTPLRYRQHHQCNMRWDGSLYVKDRVLNPEEMEELLVQCGVSSHPDCIYTYQKEKESYSLWLRRQRP